MEYVRLACKKQQEANMHTILLSYVYEEQEFRKKRKGLVIRSRNWQNTFCDYVAEASDKVIKYYDGNPELNYYQRIFQAMWFIAF